MTTKQDLGQFFTTNSDHILQGFEALVEGKTVLDPFAGGGDLLRWAEKHGAVAGSGLDIDDKLLNVHIAQNDSLESIPPTSFIITNPPYLAKNKMAPRMKKQYAVALEKYEDLYLIAVKRIMEAAPDEGIIIIPVNFFSAENSDALRKEFMTQYVITRANYFKTQVFADTTYNVVAFHFQKALAPRIVQQLTITSFPGGDTKIFDLEAQYDYRIAGREIDKITQSKSLRIVRLTEEMVNDHAGSKPIHALFNDTSSAYDYLVTPAFQARIKQNIILLNCIDTNATEAGWIKAEDVRTLGKDCLVGKNTSRNIAYVLLPDCLIVEQEKVIYLFNEVLAHYRRRYNSLFLTNFRDNNRKRISFEFAYRLIDYCLSQLRSSECLMHQSVSSPSFRICVANCILDADIEAIKAKHPNSQTAQNQGNAQLSLDWNNKPELSVLQR